MIRAANYLKLLAEYPPAENTGAAEDVADVQHRIDTGRQIMRWALCTTGYHTPYIKLFDTLDQAQEYAIETFTERYEVEIPEEIYDLDTGAKSEPTIKISWGPFREPDSI